MNQEVAHTDQASEERRLTSKCRAVLVCTLLLLLTGFGLREGHAQALTPGGGVYVTDEQTRLRAGPSTHHDVLASLERGRWLEVVELGGELTVGGVSAPWVRVRDPWAPETDAPFSAPTAGWVWGGLLRPIPEDVAAPSVANWERVLVRVDPHTRALALEGDGEAVAWAAHFDPDREGRPRTLEVAEWLRLGAAPARSWQLVGWRRLARLSVIPVEDGLSWLRIEGEGHRRQRRILLRPSLLEGEVLDLGGDRTQGATQLLTLQDGQTTELVVLEVTKDEGGQPLQRGMTRFALIADGPQPLADPAVRSALMPAPNLLVEGVSAVRRGAICDVRVAVRNEAAGADSTRLLVRAWGERVVRGAIERGAVITVEAELPALVPGRVAEVTAEVPLARSWSRLALELTVVPVPIESRLDDNRKRVAIEPQ